MRLALLAALCALLLVGCDGPVEGCTDPIAKNYNAEADKDCCCEYYQLRWSLRHRNSDSTSVALQTSYPNIGGDSFQVQSVKFLVYDVVFIKNNGDMVGIDDSLDVPFFSTYTLRYADDFTGITPSNFLIEIGKFTTLDTFAALRFSLGLAPDFESANPADVEDTHILSDSMGYYSAALQRYVGQSFSIFLPATGNTRSIRLTDSLHVHLPYSTVVEDGSDVVVPIDIRYDRLWQGIDWVNDDSLTIVQKIKTNTKDAFQLR